jgi:Protein of unknown function, DUF547
MSKRKRGLYLVILLITIVAVTLSTININEVGLSVLGYLKKLTRNSVDITNVKPVNKAITHELWDALLIKYVGSDGKVNYNGFNQSRDSLLLYLKLLSDNPPNSTTWTEQEQISYWINAYNAFTVDLILRYYPLESIQDIAGDIPMINSPWDLKFFRIGGVEFDLNAIEHEILRKQFEEPRIHFAINCASVSCPDLRNEAYDAERLDTQLDEQARSFINNSDKNIFSPAEIKLSKIFSWFKGDFETHGTVISFIQQYRPEVREGVRIKYMDYNWSLNETSE